MLENIARAHEIAAILIRYGFGDLVRRMGLAGTLARAGRALHWHVPDDHAGLDRPARMRRALEELGPTFVKLGQVLATRIDLFDPPWIAEFSRLQDETPTVPFDALRPQLRAVLGAEPEAVFPTIETTALAGGSLAQVHAATLADGTAVVLKIRRPGIRPVVEADLQLLARIAELAEATLPELRRFRLREVVRQFTRSLMLELDFETECRHAERIAANFRDRPEIVVPRVHWTWCDETLNVQDRIAGIPGRHLDAVDAAGLDRRLLAARGADAVLKMMLEDGFFHADPHPGNVFYLPDNRIALIDFGMVGRLSERRRTEIALLLQGLASRDAAAVATTLLDWADAQEGPDVPATDAAALEARVEAFIDTFHGIPLGELDLGALLTDALAILREERLPVPPDLVLTIKTFITLEGLGRALDPTFDMAGTAMPFIALSLARRHRPAALVRRGRRTVAQLARLLDDLPADLDRVLRLARRGRLKVDIDVAPLDRFAERFDRAVSRLTVGIVVAALIVGGSIVGARDSVPGSIWPTLGLIAFVASVLGGIWLVVSIVRSWRRERGDRR
ncbi:MAG: ABC1 kinase family protein [Lautropia sp.]